MSDCRNGVSPVKTILILILSDKAKYNTITFKGTELYYERDVCGGGGGGGVGVQRK